MSYNPLAELLDSSTKYEELDLPKGEFIAKIGRAYKIALLIAVFVCLIIGIPSAILWHEDGGYIFLLLGIPAILVLPTFISYRCTVNRISIKEEYLILFFRFKKEVLWESVKYRKIKYGTNSSITLYDINKKRLISFDGATVGFGRILKMAKRSSIKDFDQK